MHASEGQKKRKKKKTNIGDSHKTAGTAHPIYCLLSRDSSSFLNKELHTKDFECTVHRERKTKVRAHGEKDKLACTGRESLREKKHEGNRAVHEPAKDSFSQAGTGFLEERCNTLEGHGLGEDQMKSTSWCPSAPM